MPSQENLDIENNSLITENDNEEENNIININRCVAFKNLIISSSKLVVLCSMAALTDAYIQNELTDKKFDNFSEFFKKSSTYLSWGLAAIGFSILTDKTAFHCVDEVINNVKELITGKRYLTNEQILKKEVNKLIEKIKEIEHNNNEKIDKAIEEKIDKAIEEIRNQGKKINIQKYIKTQNNYEINNIECFKTSEKIQDIKNEPSTSKINEDVFI